MAHSTASQTAASRPENSSRTSQTPTTTDLRSLTGYQSNARSRKTRPRTALSTIAGLENQRVVCAVCESRGTNPTVGLAFVNLDTSEAVLSQISDSQTYVKTLHKLNVYAPSEVLFPSTAVNSKSQLFLIVQEDLEALDIAILSLERGYWAEDSGMTYIQQLALSEDVEAIQLAVTGNYYAVLSFAAVS